MRPRCVISCFSGGSVVDGVLKHKDDRECSFVACANTEQKKQPNTFAKMVAGREAEISVCD